MNKIAATVGEIGIIYNTSTHDCCVEHNKHLKVFNTSSQMCCGENVVAKRTPKDDGCCGIPFIQTFDYSTEICCDTDTPFVAQKQYGYYSGCCGDKQINTATTKQRRYVAGMRLKLRCIRTPNAATKNYMILVRTYARML